MSGHTKLLKFIILIYLIRIKCVTAFGDFKSTLTFVIDDTGSMKEDIAQVKSDVDAIFDTVLSHNESQIDNFIIVTFNDYDHYYDVPDMSKKTIDLPDTILRTDTRDRNVFKQVLNSITADVYNIDCPEYSMSGIKRDMSKKTIDLPDTILRTDTRDRNVFKQVLNSITADVYNIDCPEYSMSGIKRGLQASLDQSLIYVFTDAASKDYELFESVKNLAISKQCQVVFVLSPMDCTDPGPHVYYDLAKATNGIVFNLEKQEIGQLLKYVEHTIKERDVPLESKDLPPGKSTTSILVDFTIKILTIAISGNGKVDDVNVTGPNGTKPTLKTVTKTEKIHIINIEAIQAGTYEIYVETDNGAHLKVSGKSDVLLQHGFSSNTPTTIDETTPNPVPGTKSHISIAITKGDIPLLAIKIRDLDTNLMSFKASDDTTVYETPLIKFNEKFYTTELVLPPNSAFRIAIICFDSINNRNFTRLSPPIEYQKTIPEEVKPMSPSVSILGDTTVQVDYDDSLKLICRVSGNPRPDIVWRNADGIIMPSEVSIYRLPNDYNSILLLDNVKENATYECKASIGDETDSKLVTVKTTEPKHYFNVIGTLIKRHYIEYKKEGQLNCQVDAYPPANISWIRKDKELKTSDRLIISGTSNNSTITIVDAQLSDDGKYICIAKNSDEEMRIINIVHITGIVNPAIDKDLREIEVDVDSAAKISCNLLKGVPEPLITWSYKPLANNSSSHSSNAFIEVNEWSGKTTIFFENVRESNAGTYKCIATNVGGSDDHEIELIVQYAPRIKIDKVFIKVNVGNELSIKCDIKGIPTPTISWFKNGRPLSYRSITHNDKFIKENVQLDDSGNYTCAAENKLRKVAKTARVRVILPVHITPPKSLQIRAMVGDTLPLPCKATGFPEPTVQWFYRHGTEHQKVKTFSPETLVLHRIQVKQEGEYICVASNTEGSTNITYDVHVFAPPIIENKYLSNEFRAVKGDVALRITCKATGNPKPITTWSKDGFNLALGTYFYVEGDDLIIKDIAKESEGNYKCEARNDLGTATEIYEVKVDRYVISRNPTSTIRIEKGVLAEIPCKVYHTLVDQLRWYRNGYPIAIGELTLKNPTVNDAGVYTCRVSNAYGSKTSDINVMVGEAPMFLYNDVLLDMELQEGSMYELNCVASGVPEPKITWYKEGVELGTGPVYDVEMKNNDKVEKYTCEARNDYGKITRTYNIISPDCFLKTDNITNQPLLVSSRLTWPNNINTVNKQLVIKKDEMFVLYCPTHFKNIPTESLLQVFCNGKDKKIVANGAKYDYSDLQCNEKVEHKVNRAGEKCLGDNTEKINIEYQHNISFLKPIKVYEICFDNTKKIPLYAVHNMRSSLALDDIKTDWSDAKEFNIDFNDAYKCRRQTYGISASLGKIFHRGDDCCFSRRQLVNPRDVFKGVPQTATYSYLNVVPHWNTCHMENWEDLEQRVRSFGIMAYYSDDLTVWTGTAKHLTVPNSFGHNQKIYIKDRFGNSQTVPLYLWKVIQDPWTASSLAVIQVNVPDLSPSNVSKYVICKDICNRVDWMNGTQWHDVNRGYTFCCSIKDFEYSFGYINVFKPDMDQVLQINDYDVPSIHSLTLT